MNGLLYVRAGTFLDIVKSKY